MHTVPLSQNSRETIATRSTQLRNALRNDSTSADEIKKQLAALRAARETARKELVVAQQELRKTVNVRQEAQLVLMGLLD